VKIKSSEHNIDLSELLEKALIRYDTMSNDEKKKMRAEQRRSYILGEAGIGSDADEASYRAAVETGDIVKLNELNVAALERVEYAKKYLGEIE
jgi:hypothetical protein